MPLKTLAVGTVCQLCRVEPDVAALAMHLSLASALLQAVYSGSSTVYLKVCNPAACVAEIVHGGETTTFLAKRMQHFG